MVVGGVVAVVAALALPADLRLITRVFFAIQAAMLVPILVLTAIYVRSYKREFQAEHRT